MNRRNKRYSVYNRRTDLPIFIHGTSEECARALGISENSFFSMISRQRSGKKPSKSYEIFKDNKEDDSVNHMGTVARIFGMKLMEEFYVVGLNATKKARFTEDGLELFLTDGWHWNTPWLELVLTGDAQVVRMEDYEQDD